jgi:hypothetical protein
MRARCLTSPVPLDVSPSGIVGLLRHERVLLRDELEGQAAAAKDRAALYGTARKTFEHQNGLALEKTDVHIDISLGKGRGRPAAAMRWQTCAALDAAIEQQKAREWAGIYCI